MQQVQSLEEYRSLVKKVKSEHKAVSSNCFMFPDAVQRFIDLGRFYAEEMNAGVFFYSDEENYYQAYYYLDPEAELTLAPKDKPVVVQHLYAAGAKKDKLVKTEEQLSRAGFVFDNRMRQVTVDPETGIQKTQALGRFVRKMLADKGFRFCAATEDMIPQIEELQRITPEIPYDQIPYFTVDEFNEDAKNGFITVILDRDDRVCAVRRAYLDGNTIHGWVIVKPEFKSINGMGLALSEISMHLAKEKHYKICGWIDEENVASQKYHAKIGYTYLDKYTERWVLPARA